MPCGASSDRRVSARPRTAYFAGAYARVAEHADEPRGRRHGHEVAAPPLDHRRHHGPDRVQRAEVVDLHLVAEDVVVELLEVARVRRSRRGDEHVARPTLGDDRVERGARARRVVPRRPMRSRPPPPTRPRRRDATSSRASSDTRAPRADHFPCRRQPDAARTPGDHHVRAAQARHGADPATRRATGSVQACADASRPRLRAPRSRSPRWWRPPSRLHPRETDAAAAFTVQPSVDQVAVTGATEGASVVLRDAAGKEVATREVDAAGSTLFRDVPAGPRLRRERRRPRSAPVTVLAPDRHAAAVALLGAGPPTRLRLPQDARRHPALGQREAARTGRRGPLPHRRRVLGLRPVEPRRRPARVARRAAARLRDRRRQPARHRMLGRRVRLLRGAPVARRLRRDRGRRRAAVGARTATSAWSASRSPASPSCSSPRPGRRTSPRSRRCRCSTTPTTRCTRAGSSTTGSRSGGPRTARPTPGRHARRRGTAVGPQADRRRRRRPAAPTRRCGCSRPT